MCAYGKTERLFQGGGVIQQYNLYVRSTRRMRQFMERTCVDCPHRRRSPYSNTMPDKDETKGGARDDRLSGPVHNHRHREREHVRKLLMAEARDKCHETRAAYVECAKGRTLSLPFYCRDVFNKFNECLGQYTTEEELNKRIASYTIPEPGSKEAADAARATKPGGSSPFSGR